MKRVAVGKGSLHGLLVSANKIWDQQTTAYDVKCFGSRAWRE